MFRSLAGPLLLLAMTTAASAVPAQPPRVETIFADLLMNDAIGLVSGQSASPLELELGLRLAVEAALVADDDVDLWRAVLQVADLVDAAPVVDRALRAITRLDPSDQVAALRRLLNALDRQPTVDARRRAVIGLFESDRLPAPMASRIAFDLALVLQRAGDPEGYLEWLTEAVALDAANPMAVSELAGYLSATTAQTTTQVELLIARCLADPGYLPAIETLAEFLTERGATENAARLRTLLLTLRGGAASARMIEVMRAALAVWANDDPDGALRIIQRRQDREDQTLRSALAFVRQADLMMRPTDEMIEPITAAMPPLTRQETLRLLKPEQGGLPSEETIRAATAPLIAAPSALRAAILHPEVHDSITALDLSYADAAALLRDTIAAEVRFRETTPGEPAELEALAWLGLWLLHDVPEGEKWISELIRPILADLGDSISPWLAAWVALRDGDPERAHAIAADVVEASPLAEFASALALLELGRERDAARALLSVARRMPAAIGGIWARRKLERMLDSPVPLHPDSGAVEAMASTLPRTLDRLLIEPGRELVVQARPVKPDYGPFERVELLIELTNRSELPLAITPTGPLGSSIAVSLSLTSFGARTESQQLPMPILVDIGRRIRLEPWETFTVQVNLNRGVIAPQTTLGLLLLDLAPVGGHAIFRGRAVSNPVPTTFGGRRGLVEPSLLGSESAPLAFRAMGALIEDEWFERVITNLTDESTTPDPVLAATLLGWTARVNVDDVVPDLTRADQFNILEEFDRRVRAVEQAFPRLDPIGRALVTKLLPPQHSRLEPLTLMARSSGDRAVRLAVLTSTIVSATDPYLDEVRRGDDPDLRRIAELVSLVMARRSALEE